MNEEATTTCGNCLQPAEKVQPCEGCLDVFCEKCWEAHVADCGANQ